MVWMEILRESSENPMFQLPQTQEFLILQLSGSFCATLLNK